MNGLFQDLGLGAVEGIIDPLPFLAACDQLGIAEDLHVVGQRRLGQVQVFQEHAGTAFPLPQERQDAQPLFITQSLNTRTASLSSITAPPFISKFINL